MRVVDSSVIVRFVSQEEGWESVRDYLFDATTIAQALVELSNSLLKKVKTNGMPTEIAKALLEDYADSLPLLNDRDYVVTAFNMANSRNITIYDSMFVAAALRENLDLVTADRNQAKVAKLLGVRVVEC